MNTTHGEIKHLSKLQNGEITAISDYVVEEIYNQSHSIGVNHGIQIVRACTKEDFQCGDEFYFVEMKDAETFSTFANYMDYTEDIIDAEIKSDVVNFTIGNEGEGRAYRRMKRELIWVLVTKPSDYDDDWGEIPWL
tara:strand:- start:2689 stop:3096 length:408 start_codon:yes stop_codon:yes gene_type:complete